MKEFVVSHSISGARVCNRIGKRRLTNLRGWRGWLFCDWCLIRGGKSTLACLGVESDAPWAERDVVAALYVTLK